MKGAIIGDIIGSAFITHKKLSTEFQLLKPTSSFTDDTVLTIATADAIINDKCFKATSKEWISKYPHAGYNPEFSEWVQKDNAVEYKSNGDGAARRISSIGFFANSIDQAMNLAENSTVLTHNTPEMIKAAKAVATSIFLAKTGIKKDNIKDYIETNFDYKLDRTFDELKKDLEESNSETPAPVAINIFLLSYSYEDSIRKAIALGSDRSNTIASIVGGISQAYFKHIPKSIIRKALNRISPEMKAFIDSFEEKYIEDNHPAKVIMGMH